MENGFMFFWWQHVLHIAQAKTNFRFVSIYFLKCKSFSYDVLLIATLVNTTVKIEHLFWANYSMINFQAILLDRK